VHEPDDGSLHHNTSECNQNKVQSKIEFRSRFRKKMRERERQSFQRTLRRIRVLICDAQQCANQGKLKNISSNQTTAAKRKKKNTAGVRVCVCADDAPARAERTF
jgi:hypothetical protein